MIVSNIWECNAWMSRLLRSEQNELEVFAVNQPKNMGIWQKSKSKDLKGNEITEGQFIRVDPLGDWIEDHGGKREWSDEIIVLGTMCRPGGNGKSVGNLKNPVRVDHCGLVDQEDSLVEDDGSREQRMRKEGAY